MFIILITNIFKIKKYIKNKLYKFIKNLKNLNNFLYNGLFFSFWLSKNTMPFEIYFFGENLI